MSMDDVHARPAHLIRRAHQVSMALFAEECGGDLTSVQYAALVAIRENPGVDATRLSDLIAFDRSTLGGVLERLEAKGLIRRGASPADRRVKLLTLTPEGRVLLRRVGPAVTRVQDRLMEAFTAAEREIFMALLRRLVAHSEAATALEEA